MLEKPGGGPILGYVEGPTTPSSPLMKAILVFFHVPSNTGYAIATCERVFWRMAKRLVDVDDIHFAYTSLSGGRPTTLPEDFHNVIAFDPTTRDRQELDDLGAYVRTHDIDVAFGFDQPVQGRPCYRAMRDAGVKTLVSYWGAPMSSINRGPKLWAKRIEVALRHGPDHYIFESEAMRDTATHGRGVPARATTVVYLSVDPSVFTPDRPSFDFGRLGVPEGRKVILFSGHVGERRKGCDVLVKAAMRLSRERADFQVVLCGNKGSEADWLVDIVGNHPAREHVTFAGYRSDLSEIMPSCYLGVIPSTGWDSFTMSSLELQASGVPLLVSDLQGLPEAIEQDRTGMTFPPGDDAALAEALVSLLDDPERRDRMGKAARARIVDGFSLDHQTDRLVTTLRSLG